MAPMEILAALFLPMLRSLWRKRRAVGEFGSVVFIAGNLPMKTEITPLLIITKLEQYDYAGATAIALVMLAISFALLLVINGLQAWHARRNGTDQARPGALR